MKVAGAATACGASGAGEEADRSPPVAPVRYIHSHAALRGFAALVVAYRLQFGAPHRLAIETATPFFERGYLLVDLFFILSGFVISLTGDAGRASPLSARETEQLSRRFLRRVLSRPARS